jgi:hypothetical protein
MDRILVGDISSSQLPPVPSLQPARQIPGSDPRWSVADYCNMRIVYPSRLATSMVWLTLEGCEDMICGQDAPLRSTPKAFGVRVLSAPLPSNGLLRLGMAAGDRLARNRLRVRSGNFEAVGQPAP